MEKLKEIIRKEIVSMLESNKYIKDGIDIRELKVGIEVEMEHTDNRDEAKKIAIDHLRENPNYYTIHVRSGLVDEPKAIEFYNKYLKNKEV